MNYDEKISTIKYSCEIFVIAFFIIISYSMCTNCRLASYASIAEQNYKANINLQVVYGRNTEAVLNKENLLDKGTLSIKNPNKHEITAIVNLKVSSNAELDKLNIEINGKTLNLETKELYDDYYVIPVEECFIEAYQNIDFETDIYGNPYNISNFNYVYDVQEVF